MIDPTRFAASRPAHYLQHLLGVELIGSMFPWLAGMLLVLLTISTAVAVLAGHLSERHGAACRNRLSRQVLERCIGAPYVWIVSQNAADLVRRIHDDVRTWRKDYVQALLMLAQSAIMIVFPSAVAVALSPVQGLLTIIVAAVLAGVAVAAVRPRLARLSVQTLRAHDATMKSLLQVINGIREVKVSDHSQFFVNVVDRCLQTLTALGERARVWGNAPANIVRLLGQGGFVATAILLWVWGYSGAEIAAQLALIGVVVTRVIPGAEHVNRAIYYPHTRSSRRTRAPAISDRHHRSHPHLRSPAPIARNRAQSMAGGQVRGCLGSISKHRTLLSLAAVDVHLERGKLIGFVGRSGGGQEHTGEPATRTD